MRADSYVVLLQVEQVAQLATFSEALLEYHQQCTEILRGLTETLLEKYVWCRKFNKIIIKIACVEIDFHNFLECAGVIFLLNNTHTRLFSFYEYFLHKARYAEYISFTRKSSLPFSCSRVWMTIGSHFLE